MKRFMKKCVQNIKQCQQEAFFCDHAGYHQGKPFVELSAACRNVGSYLVLFSLLLIFTPLVVGSWYANRGVQILERTEAISYLETAIFWLPFDPQVRRWLANAYTLQGRDEEALKALEHAYRLCPHSLLIGSDLARAYRKSGNLSNAVELYKALGFSAEYLFQVADKKLWLNQPREAFETYLDAIILAENYSPSVAFRIGSTAVAIQDPQFLQWFEKTGFDIAAHIYALGSTTTWIEVEDLHYLEDGLPLRNSPAKDPSIGAMWWAGTAIAFVSTDVTGLYTLRLRAQHSKPPVEFLVVINGIAIENFSYDRADESWEEKAVTVHLRSGLNTIGVRLVDGSYTTNGDDRNGFVDWITLTPVSDCC